MVEGCSQFVAMLRTVAERTPEFDVFNTERRFCYTCGVRRNRSLEDGAPFDRQAKVNLRSLTRTFDGSKKAARTNLKLRINAIPRPQILNPRNIPLQKHRPPKPSRHQNRTPIPAPMILRFAHWNATLFRLAREMPVFWVSFD
jgi:hypothetical protein